MTMQLSIIIDANGNAAIATVEKLGKSVKTTGAATEGMGAKSRKAAADTKSLGTQSSATQTKVVSLSTAQRTNAATAQAMGTANRAAAGNMGNLVAQFNDIGVMMAAGQNPLTLALQQGTQISQVIGPMGAAGAVKALGGAFIGMLNPISLVTIGVIGGGAALAQWASSALGAKGEARTFDETLEDLTSTVSDYRSLADLASASTSDLEKRFGSASGSAKEIGGFLAEWARIDAVEKLDASVAGLSSSLGDLQGEAANIGSLTDAQLKPIADNFGVTVNVLRTFSNEAMSVMSDLSSEYGITNDQAATLMLSLRGFGQASGVSEQVAAAVELNEQFKLVFGKAEAIPISLRDVARQAGLIALQAGEITGAFVDTNTALANQYALYGASRIESDAQLGTAQALLDQLNEQATLQAIIAKYGADSAEAIGFQALAARDAYEATHATEGVSADMRDRIMEAYDAANGLAGVNIAGNIGAASAEAQRLATWLGISLERAAALAATTPEMSDEDRAMGVSLTPQHGGAYRARVAGATLDRRNAAAALRQTSSSGGGGASSSAARDAERQQEAVARLTQGLEDELAILRELDPIQKEMLRNRETLASASTAERDQIEALIGMRNAETAALELQQEQWDFTKDTAVGFFDDLRNSSGGLMGALEGVASKLEDIVFQAILLGEGPLAGLFGTSGGGGIIGTIMGGLFPSLAPAAKVALPAKADGGKIYGPGSGTSDDVLMWGSDGEFMMTAKATQKYQPILEMMNNGALPTFAAGGKLGGGSSGASMSLPPIAFSIENRGSTPVKGNVTEEGDGYGGRKMKLVLADEVGAALSTPGGGARKQLQGAYGLRKRTASR